MNEEIIQSSQGRLGSESLSCWFGMVSPSLRHSAGASWTLRQDMLYGWKPRRPFPDPVLSGPRRHNTKGHCRPRASSAKTRGFHTQLDEGPETP